MKRLLFSILLLSMVVAADPSMTGNWFFREIGVGLYQPNFVPTMTYDGDDMILTIDSDTTSRGMWKLFATIPHPEGNSWELEMKVKVDAPNIELDGGKYFASGETYSDGPNFFSIFYAYTEPTLEKPGFAYTGSMQPYPSNSEICHANMQCNYLGPDDDYCIAETYEYAGWVAEGAGLGNYDSNVNTAEAFTEGEWKTIRMIVDAGECVKDNITLMFMGTDFFDDRYYKWQIKDMKIKTATEAPLSFESMYKWTGTEWTKVSVPAYCGDGKKNQDSEECDGSDGVSEGWTCSSSCKLQTTCGDSIIAGQEVCDGLKVTSGFECASDCLTETPVCGDNLVVSTEACDGANVTTGFSCASDCKSKTPICGDGVLVEGEDCDGTQGLAEGFLCSNKCVEYRKLSTSEQTMVEKILPLAATAVPGKPALTSVSFSGKGNLSSSDLSSQIGLLNSSILSNSTILFCVKGNTVCEADFVIADPMLQATAENLVFTGGTFEMKAYAPSPNNSVYYVGLSKKNTLLPQLEMDNNFWLIVGVVAFLFLLSVGLLLLIVGGFFFYSKKKGFNMQDFIKKILK